MLLGRKVAPLQILIALAIPLAVTSVANAQEQPRGAGGSTGTNAASPSAAPPAATSQPQPQPQQGTSPAPRDASGNRQGDLLPTTTTTPPATPMPPSPASATSAGPGAPSMGMQRPPGDANGEFGASPSEVYSEDWWGHTRPILELHGYFRTRGELFHNFSLGRHDTPGAAGNSPNAGLWSQPLDNSFTGVGGATNQTISLCGSVNANGTLNTCNDSSQPSANLRFRMNPELHISDNLRVLSEIDALDNVVLGSTPNSLATTPSKNGGYAPAGFSGYAPLGFNATTQGAPTAGVNGFQNSINVKRAWAEYMTPVGQLRFGRMPDHWGLGMMHNAGNGIDSDWQSTIDRIMFVSGIKSMDLYFGGSWDFVATGPTSATPYTVYGGQPYNTCQLCNVAQYSAFAAHRTNPELQRLQLSRGEFVVNGGVYGSYRSQWIDVATGTTGTTALDTTAANGGLEARRAWEVTPDAWVQLLFKKFRFEAEFAMIWGQIANSPQFQSLNNPNSSPAQISQFGLATQTEYRAIEDKLHLEFGFGWASGDSWASTLSNGSQSAANGFVPRQELNGGQGPISTFAFHPDYRVDLIFFRNILTQVEGAYYFRPSVDYDFLRHPDGQKLGGGAAVIWSRASEFMQAPGHKRDLGVELDLQLYYQAKDGSLNDDATKVGGFFAMLQYGVFFPLGGLAYPSGTNAAINLDTSAAQTVRLFLGVAY
jgi:uncharacterized protein (TIGR04551 family)